MTSTLKFVQSHKLQMIMFLMFLISIAFPDMALAQESTENNSKYNFAPSDEVRDGFSSSYTDIWGMIAEGLMWGAIIWLGASVLFLKGKLWWISPIVFMVAFFGEDAVRGGKVKAGINKTSVIQMDKGYHSETFAIQYVRKKVNELS